MYEVKFKFTLTGGYTVDVTAKGNVDPGNGVPPYVKDLDIHVRYYESADDSEGVELLHGDITPIDWIEIDEQARDRLIEDFKYFGERGVA